MSAYFHKVCGNWDFYPIEICWNGCYGQLILNSLGKQNKKSTWRLTGMKNCNLKPSRGKIHSGGENLWEALVQKVNCCLKTVQTLLYSSQLNCCSLTRNIFHSSAFALTVHGTLPLSFCEYKAVSLITGCILVALDKINLHLTLFIFKCWLMCSVSLCLKYPNPLQPYQLHCSGGTQRGWILTLFSRCFNEQNSRKLTSF